MPRNFLEHVLTRATYQPRVRTALIAAFGVAAVLLAAIGIYGVVSYRVARRRKEIAIRVAIGAERMPIPGLVVGEGFELALLGAVLGCAIARVAAPAVSNLLYRVDPTDSWTMLSAAAVCVAVAILACLIPGWRAARVDPMTALRLD